MADDLEDVLAKALHSAQGAAVAAVLGREAEWDRAVGAGGASEGETGKLAKEGFPPGLLPGMEAWFNETFDFDPYADEIEACLARMAADGGAAGLEQIRDRLGADQAAAFGQLVNQVNERAADWAKERCAWLVTDISDATRHRLAGLIAEGIGQGWSVQELAAQIVDSSSLFDPARARMIARTELAAADVAGNKLAYAESGVVTGLQWQCPNGIDDKTCAECAMNHGAIVPLGPDGEATKPYPSGADGVPAHPNCRCDEFPVMEPIGDANGQ